ncbi:unnamed protein product [Effrenium voratum]|nr:unnamed protein product [Effrenium voratum]
MVTSAMEDDRVFDFKLVEKMTFLEYLPVCRRRRSASCPARLNQIGLVEYLSEAPVSHANHSASLTHCLRRPKTVVLFPKGSPRSSPSYAKAGSNETLTSTAETATTMCSLEDADCTESPPHDREPEESVGSSLHPHRCKPCAWFWRTVGCARGADCQHCHACLPGELAKRRRQNRVLAKSIRRLAQETPQVALPKQPCLPPPLKAGRVGPPFALPVPAQSIEFSNSNTFHGGHHTLPS